MTPSELRRRVTLDTWAAAAALAAPAAWIGGAPAGLGVLTGGGLAIVNFRWLVARAAAVTAAPGATAGTGSGAASAWRVGSGVALGARRAAVTLPVAAPVAHPNG